MSKIFYGRGAYRRNQGNLPAFDVINMVLEQSPTDESGVVMQSRKALGVDVEVGSGPVRATLKKSGVFGGDRFTLSGGNAYRGTTLLGAVTGDGVASIAASDIEVLFCAGGSLYSYDGTDFVAVDFPDDQNVIKIIHAGGYFIALVENAGAFYFSAVLDGRSWDGADFATPESEADYTLDAVMLDGIIAFFGIETVEFWAKTGDPDLPYSPIEGRTFEQGIIATGCAVAKDNTFFFVGNDKIVYRNGEIPLAISDDGIVEKSVASSTHRLFVLEDERHKYLCLRLDTETMAFDIASGEWSEFQSYGRANFKAMDGFGDDTDGTIWKWDGYDEGPMLRLLTAGTPLQAPAHIDCIRLTSEVGTTPNLTGEYTNPIVEMRTSDDGGNTWSDWEQTELGEQGQYRERVEWRALGMFDDPGFLMQVRVIDPVSWRLSDVQVNPGGGGRSR